MRSAFILIGVCVLPSATPLSVQPLFRPASSRAGVGPWMQTNGFAERLDPRTRLAELDAQRASLSDSEYLQRMRDIVQDSARELSAACDRGDDEACEALSVEERAKAQWLARGVVSPTGSSEVERQRAEIARLQNELGSISDSLYSRMQGQPAANPTIREARIVLPLAALGTIGWLALPKPTVYLPRPPAAPVGESGLEVPAMVPAVAPMPAAEAEAAATAKYFPGALLSPDLDSTLTTTLEKRGFTAENTLFATSTCPDEVNYKSGEIIDLLEKRWGKSFALGGLGGVPFVGRVGFGAYSHHVPDGGKMLIVFAPHIGIIDDGTVGKIVRPNQAAISTACGAAVGAFKALMKEKEEGKAPAMTADYFDAQIAFIKAKLASRLNEVADAPDANAFVAYQMYALIREFVVDTVLSANLFDYGEEMTVLGGIQVNRASGGDVFMPMMLQTRGKEEGTTVDLYEETFGAPPETKLREVLAGSNIDLYDYKLAKSVQPAVNM